MSQRFGRRPSASLIVALLALVVAMSGSAVAATRLFNGDRVIRKGTLSGNRLRRHTLTGVQINLNKLGKVPSAAHADQASIAVNATNATDALAATDALNAGNAAQLGGQPASSYLTSASRIGTGGVVTVAGTAGGATRTLVTHGPFTVTMTCTTSGAATGLTVTATSTEANSDLDGTVAPTAGAATDLTGTLGTLPRSGFFPTTGSLCRCRRRAAPRPWSTGATGSTGPPPGTASQTSPASPDAAFEGEKTRRRGVRMARIPAPAGRHNQALRSPRDRTC